MRRGEIWTVAGGLDYAGKPRPSVIVQNDLFPEVQSITLCGLTSEASDSPLTRPLINPSDSNGLKDASRVMIDKITTVPHARLGRRVGALSPAEMERIDLGLLVFLGLAR